MGSTLLINKVVLKYILKTSIERDLQRLLRYTWIFLAYYECFFLSAGKANYLKYSNNEFLTIRKIPRKKWLLLYFIKILFKHWNEKCFECFRKISTFINDEFTEQQRIVSISIPVEMSLAVMNATSINFFHNGFAFKWKIKD